VGLEFFTRLLTQKKQKESAKMHRTSIGPRAAQNKTKFGGVKGKGELIKGGRRKGIRWGPAIEGRGEGRLLQGGGGGGKSCCQVFITNHLKQHRGEIWSRGIRPDIKRR